MRAHTHAHTESQSCYSTFLYLFASSSSFHASYFYTSIFPPTSKSVHESLPFTFSITGSFFSFFPQKKKNSSVKFENNFEIKPQTFKTSRSRKKSCVKRSTVANCASFSAVFVRSVDGTQGFFTYFLQVFCHKTQTIARWIWSMVFGNKARTPLVIFPNTRVKT